MIWVVGAACVTVLLALALALARAAGRPDPVDAAYNSLPCGRPLRIDTTTGSHDSYPHMTDNIRHFVTAYCEDMWQHATTNDREYPR